MIQYKSIIKTIALALVLAFICTYLQAQDPIDQSEKQRTIDSLSAVLNKNYVFPEIAAEIEKVLKNNLNSGTYDNILTAQQFANQLTTDIRSINNDRHLRVNFSPEGAQRMRDFNGERPEPTQEMLDDMRRDNYGFHEMKILEGNIGYLDLRGFYQTRFGGETAAAAMNFLAGTDAIIFDLRNNGGGSPSMIQLLTSYLYEADDQIHLNNFYFRPVDEITQTWVLPYVPGTRNPDCDVYVLTSNRTFSAAEEFTYNLKNLDRATIIGEITGGGAHPGGTMAIADRFICFVPSGRAINPITDTNWEGTGVEPDIEVPADQALSKAHVVALEKLVEKAEGTDRKAYYKWFTSTLDAKYNPKTLPNELLKSYAGKYGFRTLIYDNGELFYQREGNSKLKLYTLSDNVFSPEGLPDFKLTVELKDGKAVALLAESLQGYSEKLERSDEEGKP